jgi:hypothetical protein
MVGVETEQDISNVIRIAHTVDLVALRLGGFPQHDTSKCVGILVHILLYQRLDLVRSQIEPCIRCSLTRRQSNIKLCIRVGACLDDIYPLIKVEAVLGAIHKVTGRARVSVVPLNPNEINGCVFDGNSELLVRDGALRSGRDVVGLVGVFTEALSKHLDHVGIPCICQNVFIIVDAWLTK